MRLYIVTFELDGEFWSEPFMANDHDDAEEQCKDINPPEVKIICTVRIPFHVIERAYYLEKARRA